ncbi:MAG: NAD(P)-binding protein, partial [Candidatus Eisenbacteria sp.]|nr:NAD(P)-binding protein [Candidatus Eisenbacteria bacterium]
MWGTASLRRRASRIWSTRFEAEPAGRPDRGAETPPWRGSQRGDEDDGSGGDAVGTAVTRDAGIIGAGPAGIAAAVQLARHGVAAVVFEGGPTGGLLRTAWRVENFPGFPGGISGPELVGLL